MVINKRFILLALLATASCFASPAGYLGVALTDISPAAHIQGVMIGQVAANSPASRSGLHPGDLIRSIDGHPVSSAHAAQSYVFSHNAGDVLAFELLRQGPRGYVASRVEVKLDPPAGAPVPEKRSPAKPPAKESPKNSSSSERNIQYRRYVDPAERAFSDMVPEGWRVGGRLVRYGPVTIAPFLQAMSPDGLIFVQLGDWHIQDYSDIPGWREGTVYTPGTSVMLVRRVESAQQYARSYGLKFGKWLGCEDSQFGDSEVVQTPAGLPTVPTSRVETSLAHFTCVRSGQKYVGRVMTTVQSYRLPMRTVGWNVLYLASVLVRQDLAETGIAVWDRMRGSSQFLPEWNARESAIAREATKPAQRALDSALQETQAFDRNVINGSITVNDPTTGTHSEIPIGVAPYYFSDGNGHYYSSYNPAPRLGFHTVTPER